MGPAREEILEKLRAALGRQPGAPVAAIPRTARIAPRQAAAPEAELAQLLTEIGKLSGVTRRLASREEFRDALAELVRTEAIKRATCWTTPGVEAWGVATTLQTLGVEIVPGQADKRIVASCELGVTGVDAALPETGTLALISSPRELNSATEPSLILTDTTLNGVVGQAPSSIAKRNNVESKSVLRVMTMSDLPLRTTCPFGE